jgi:hypothetical protein
MKGTKDPCDFMVVMDKKETYEQHIIIILDECYFCIERCDEVNEDENV